MRASLRIIPLLIVFVVPPAAAQQAPAADAPPLWLTLPPLEGEPFAAEQAPTMVPDLPELPVVDPILSDTPVIDPILPELPVAEPAAPELPAAEPAPAEAEVAASAPAVEPVVPPANGAAADGIVTIGVFGDSLAEGLWGGLYRKLVRDERFEVLRRAQHSTGLSRSDYYDWNTALDQFLAEDPIDAAVVSVGLNDLQAIYLDGSHYVPFKGEDWDRTYAERVVALMRRLHDANIPTLWIGLPIMRSEGYAADIAHLNAIYESSASTVGVTFVPLWDLTADAEGKYSSYLEDQEGRSRLMRANDGIHFTTRGYDLLAEHLYQVLTTAVPVPEEAATP